MADVIGNDRRGQVILVAGLLVATTLLVLVLLLNAVIYTENVATRGIEGDTDAAAEFQTTVVSEVEAIIAAEHARQREGPDEYQEYENLTQRINESLVIFESRTSERWQGRGRLASFTHTLSEGLLAWQSTDDDLTVDQNLTANAERVSNFTINISTSSLHEFEVDDLENVTEESIEANATGIRTDGEAWEIRIFRINGGAVVTDGGNVSACDVDTFDGSRSVIDITNESVNDTPCDGIWEADGTPPGVAAPFDLEVDNPQNVSGQYRLVASGDNLASGAQNSTSIVGAANLMVTFESAQIEYNATATAEVDPP